jgi:hypothetical protein
MEAENLAKSHPGNGPPSELPSVAFGLDDSRLIPEGGQLGGPSSLAGRRLGPALYVGSYVGAVPAARSKATS